LPVLTNIQKIIGGKISIWVSLFQISNPKSNVSNHRTTDFTICGYEIFCILLMFLGKLLSWTITSRNCACLSYVP